ncbi:MAG: hypothetical protein RIS94_553 [Pseudomonadota bacterium]|jgi:hypothetical protein
MTDPISFATTSSRHALPMLFAGQSQKEVTVNEALALADLLIHPVVQGVASAAPASPLAGQCWIVANGATGAFAGKDKMIAGWTEGGWRFLPPCKGMRAFDATLGSHRIYTTDWSNFSAPAAVSGGTVVDAQARAAIAALVSLLQGAGIFSAT